MKDIKFILFAVAVIVLAACKREISVVKPVNLSSLTIVNALGSTASFVPNFSNSPVKWYSSARSIDNNAYYGYAVPSGAIPVGVRQVSDTTQAVFAGQLVINPQNSYSFFLSGLHAEKPDTVFIEDHIPIYPDSSAGARFINLSPDSQSLTINLQGNNQTEFSNLKYKTITPFKKYAATNSIIANGGYAFEVRDGAGHLLTTFNWQPQAFNKSNTLVVGGLVSDGTINVFPVNNY